MTAPHRVLRPLWAATTVLVAAVVGATYTLLETERANVLAEGESRVMRFVDGAEAAINRSLLGIDALLAGLADPLREPLRRDELAAVSPMLRQVLNQNLTLRDVALLSVDGKVLASAQDSSLRVGVGLPAGFLQAAQASSGMTISEPVMNTVTAEPALYFARALQAGDQRRVLVAEVPVSLVASIVSQSVEIDGLSVTLERADGQLLASAPSMQLGRVERRLAMPVQAASANGQPWRAPGRLDQRPSILAARPTLYPGVLLAGSLRLDVALQEHQERRAIVLASAGGFVLLLLLVAGLGHWYVRRLSAAQAELAASKATLEQALASMGDGFLLWDKRARVVAWNDRYLELFPWLRGVIGVGVSADVMAQVNVAHAMPDATEAEREAWMAWRREMRLQGHGTFAQRAAKGVIVDTIERRTPNGGTVSVYRDVTAQERELAAAKEAAEAANEAKTRFLATMSHEMRTPLNGVLGLIGLMLGSRLDERQRKQAELIRSSGQTLLAVLNDVLDLSKVEAGRMELELLPFGVADTLNEVVSLLQVRAESLGLALHLHLAPDLPPVLMGDAGRLRQVMFNLVGNALKFTEAGQVAVRVHHRMVDGLCELTIEVEDTGIGIAPEVLPRLFARFEQGERSTARRFGGTGLGLAISREIVSLMNGHIDVRSQLGLGSCFTVVISLAPGQLPPAPVPDAGQPASPAPQAALRRLRVLAAEDNPVNQILVQTLVENAGHHCDLVENGIEAVARVQAQPYDLVLMDIQMPEMDGVAATRAIRALRGPAASLPIIAMTANVLRDQQDEYLAVGMNAVVAKPIAPDELATVLASLVGTPG